MTGLLEDAGLNPVQVATAQLMVANRLIEPLSEWALIGWSHRTALPELLGIRITKTTKDRLYHTSDLMSTPCATMRTDSPHNATTRNTVKPTSS